MKPDFDEREAHEPGDTLPEQAGVYVPPRPIAPLSDHRTMDVKAIRIAAEIDPRQALTQLRMQPPPRRRGSKALLVGAVLVALLVAGAYLGFSVEQPLPLVTSPATAAAPATPGTAAAAAATELAATATVAPLAAKAPPSEPSAPVASAARSEPPPSTTPAPRAAKTARAAGAAGPARKSAAPSAKIGRDPWLE